MTQSRPPPELDGRTPESVEEPFSSEDDAEGEAAGRMLKKIPATLLEPELTTVFRRVAARCVRSECSDHEAGRRQCGALARICDKDQGAPSRAAVASLPKSVVRAGGPIPAALTRLTKMISVDEVPATATPAGEASR